MKSVVQIAGSCPDTFPQRFSYPLSFLAIGLSVFLLHSLLTFFGSTLFDDAYMFIRYADNLLQGYGMVWNRGEEPVYGTTSLVYCLIVACVRAVLRLFDISASGTLITCSSMLGLAAVCCLSLIRSNLLKAGTFIQSLTLYLWVLVFLTPLLIHSFFGMDTTLSLLANCLLIYTTLKFILHNSKDRINLLILTISAYFAYAVRPDNLICALLFPTLALLFFIDKPTKKILYFLIGLTALIIIDSFVKYLWLNDPLPLSFFAKRNGFYEGYTGYDKWNPISYLLAFIACCAPFFAFTRIKKDTLTCKLFILFFTPILITFAYHTSMIQIMGHMGRFQFPFLPYVIVFTLISGLRFRGVIQKNSRYWLINMFILASIYIMLILFNTFISPFHIEYSKRLSAENRFAHKTQYYYPAQSLGEGGQLNPIDPWKLMLKIGEFSKQLPNGSAVAMSEYGYMGAVAPHIKIIDTIGLHSSDIAHNGFNVENLFAQKPDIISIPDSVYTHITSRILDNAIFQSDYEYYQTAFLSGIAFYKNSPFYDEIQVLFNQLWVDTYGDTDKTRYLTLPVTNRLKVEKMD